LDYLLQMKNMRKDYAGVTVLSDVNLTLEKGEVLALVGENGAGKSTLMKLLSGSVMPTSGEIYIDGIQQHFKNPFDAIEMGISTIYQELNYYKDLTVAENIYSGRLPVSKKLKKVDWKKLNSDAQQVLAAIGVDISATAVVNKLTVAEKQLVEIAKAVSRNNRIIIMDEPTATLNTQETDSLFQLISRLKKNGVSIIFISHRLEELFIVADRVMVLRDGKYIGERAIREINREEIIRMMVGREITNLYPRKVSHIGDTVFEANNICGGIVQDSSVVVREGEIVSVFGLMGSGQTEFFEELFGARKMDSGEMKLDGKTLKIKSPADAVAKNIAYVPPERKTTGLCLAQTIHQNILGASIDRYKKGIAVDQKREKADVKTMIGKLAIKCQGAKTEVKALSGGNQQKVLLAKWILRTPRMIMINEPTRGVDVETKTEIYEIMDSLCQEGYSILMISSEMPEVLALSDRIYVMCRGKINASFSRGEATQDKLMEYAIGW